MRRWTGTLPEAISVGLMAAAVLVLELTFTRITSSVLQFQFTFVVITLSLAGLGLGALLAATGASDRGRFVAGAAFGAVTLAAVQATPFVVRIQGAHYWLMALVLLPPFVLAGRYITGTFLAHPQRVGLLYAADLAGAAAGCLTAAAAMNAVGPVPTARLAALAGSASVLCHVPRLLATLDRHLAIGGLGAAVFPLALFPWLGAGEGPFSSPPSSAVQPLTAEDGGSTVVRTYWDAFARTDVVRDRASPDRLEIFTNGNVPSTMFRVPAPLAAPSAPSAPLPPPTTQAGAPFPSPTTQARQALEQGGLPGTAGLPFLMAPPGRVLSIGPGGGLDLLLAIGTEARHVDAVEVNPSIPKILRDYATFNGSLVAHPIVDIVTDEGRHFLENTDHRYDLIFAALTQSGVGAPSMILPESHFSTREGFQALWRHLAPDGRAALVFHNPAYAYRYLATATAALRATDSLFDGEVLARTVLMYGDDDPYRVLLLFQKQPVSAEAASRLARLADTLGLRVVHLPPRQDGGLGRVLAGEISLARHLSVLDASVGIRSAVIATDDRPYFLDLELKVPRALLTMLLAGLAGLGVLAWRAPKAGTPPRSRGRARSRAHGFGWRGVLLGAACTGMGFVTFEILTIEALGRALGDPTGAVVVTLLTVLLAGSGASLLAARGTRSGWLRWETLRLLPAAVAVGCLAIGVNGGFPAVFASSSGTAFPLVALVGLVGLVAAGAFAAVLCVVGRDAPPMVPWLWAANSIGTVIGGVVAVGAPRLVGIGWTWQLGGIFYALAGLALLAHPRPVAAPPRSARSAPPDATAGHFAA